MTAVAVPVLVLVGLMSQGRGYPVTSHPMDSGAAWFASLSVGRLTLIDGPSKQVVTDVGVAEPGAAVAAVQAGTGAYVADRTAGTVVHVDGATYSPSEAVVLIDGAGPGLEVFAGERWVYVLDRQRGAVVVADPTLRRAQPPASLAAAVSDGVVDNDGRLWVLDGASGDLVALDGGGRRAIGGLVDPARAAVELAGDRLAVIDQTARAIHVVEPRSREIVGRACLDVAPDDRSVRVAGSADARRVHAVSGQRGVLLTVDLDSGDCSAFVQVAEPGAVFGVPQEAGGRVFVPDFSTGQVHIVDLADGRVTADADLFDKATEFELLARNGIVFYNEPNGRRAGVIDLDGTVHRIDKYGRRNRAGKGPGRGRRGDAGTTPKRDDGAGESGDDRDGQRDRDGDPDQRLDPLGPASDSPTAPPDLGLPPATGAPATGPDGSAADPLPGINPPIFGDDVPPPPDIPGDTNSEPPDTTPPDPPVERPIALIGCSNTSPVAGEELQCNWMVPAAGPDDPPGTSYGGRPDTWEWRMTGPEEATATGNQFNHTMQTPGTYELALTVTNAAGTDTATRTITVGPAPPTSQPPAITGMNCTTTRTPPRVGDTVTCVATTTGDVDTMEWSWVPPTTGAYQNEQPSLNETFQEPGTHRITVEVEGPEGIDSETRTIDVVAQPQITGLSCHSPGGLGNEDPPAYFGNQLLTCDVNVSGQVNSYDWVLDLTGFRGTSAQFQAGLPGMDPGERQPGQVDVTVSGPGGSDSGSFDFIVRACDNHPDPPCARR